MGIPHLFRHLAANTPGAVRVLPPDARITCEDLYLDFNSVIHNCARVVLDALPACGGGDTEAAIVDETVRHLDRLIRRLRPRRTVFVAVDGVPPRAKMHQQRMRRFMSAWRTERGIDAGVWDKNAITPGTAFMASLADALHAYAAGYSSGLDVEVSDATAKGEGEQKMFGRMRARPSKDVVVYGLDADLLLMAMLFPGHDAVRVVREQGAGQDDAMQIVDVKALVRGVSAAMAHPSDFDEDVIGSRVRDFVALTLLLGNDFVPALPGMRIRDGAIDALIRAYKTVRTNVGDGRVRLAVGGPDALGGINTRVLAALFRALADCEDGTVARADKAYYDRSRWASRTPTASRDVEDYPAHAPFPPIVRPGDGSGWRLRYYHHLFGVSDAASVREACLLYVAGVAWSLCYLEQRCLSTGWCYPHEYAPTARDLCNLLADTDLAREVGDLMDASERRMHVTAPLPEGWQLLLVLPPASAALLPSDAVRRVMLDPELGCTHAFPRRINVATYLRDKLWECMPLLPPVDVEAVRVAVGQAVGQAVGLGRGQGQRGVLLSPAIL